MSELKIIIDRDTIADYMLYYFKLYPLRKKPPITNPIPPSLNQWMVMKRFQMNHQKQAWKEFGGWLVIRNGLENRKIEKCQIVIEYFFEDNRKRDADNYTPKNLFDAFTKFGLIVDDDFSHVESLTIKGGVDKKNPRAEITFIY